MAQFSLYVHKGGLKPHSIIYNIYRNMHIISIYHIISNIGRAALEQVYKHICKLGSNYILIHLYTKSIGVKSIENNLHNICFPRQNQR